MHGKQYLVLIYWKEFAKKDPSLFPANKLKPINERKNVYDENLLMWECIL